MAQERRSDGSPRSSGKRGQDRRGRGGSSQDERRRGGDQGGERSSVRKGGQPKGASRGGDRPSQDRPRSQDQKRYDGPPLDDSITGAELDKSVRQQLRGLPEKLATRVARHLAAAGQMIDEDPQTAFEHTLAARARASRVAIVREACGEAAYAAGEYATALSELRAAKRMNGATDYLPAMADCERALGRPDKALALAKSPAVEALPPDLKAEMTIVEAGARRDMGDLEAAVRTLENAPLQSRSRADWLVRLRYAYADALLAAGRSEEALAWFHRTVAVDGEQITDADERAEALERSGGPEESEA